MISGAAQPPPGKLPSIVCGVDRSARDQPIRLRAQPRINAGWPRAVLKDVGSVLLTVCAEYSPERLGDGWACLFHSDGVDRRGDSTGNRQRRSRQQELVDSIGGAVLSQGLEIPYLADEDASIH